MSKRAGTFVTLDDLLDAVGTDAARWFFASRAAHVEIDFDIELAKKQSAENPVYYVQYAHARIASILRKASEAGLAPAADVDGLLAGEAEGALARAVSRFPEVLEDAVAGRGDAGDHGLRHGARDAVPRVLPGRPRRGRRRARALRDSAWPSHSPPGRRWRTRWRCSGSPRPSRCSAAACRSPARPADPCCGERLRRPASARRPDVTTLGMSAPPAHRTAGRRAHRIGRRPEAAQLCLGTPQPQPAHAGSSRDRGRARPVRPSAASIPHRLLGQAQDVRHASQHVVGAAADQDHAVRLRDQHRGAAPGRLELRDERARAPPGTRRRPSRCPRRCRARRPWLRRGPRRARPGRRPTPPPPPSTLVGAALRGAGSPSCISPIVSWSGTVQPLPSLAARSSGNVTTTGFSPDASLSAWRICSVESGGLAKRSSIAPKPPFA